MALQAFLTRTEEETIALGRELGPRLQGVVLLIGNLGAGKTTLTRGIVEGRGVVNAEEVSSPTFPLIHQYGEAAPVYHVDLYRLDEARQAERLGLEEIFASGALVLLEWAERFPSLLPMERTEIRITAQDDDSRRIEITSGAIDGEP